MSQRGIVLAWVFLASAIAGSARGELTAFWRNNPITPEAIADDPVLAGMQSWSLMASNTDGWWASSGLRAVLPSGYTFYRNSQGGSFHPTAPQVSAHPAVEFHTYVTSPHNQGGANAPVLLGPFPQNMPPQSFGGSSDALPGTFSVAWADPVGHKHVPGTFEIVRLTYPATLSPTVHPTSSVDYVNPEQTVLVPTTIPECHCLAAALGVLLIRLRRRRSNSS